MSLHPGTRLGPYEITAAIGAGGVGEVYRAKDTQLNRDVAIKVLPAAVAGDGSFSVSADGNLFAITETPVAAGQTLRVLTNWQKRLIK